jgi:transcriptional/translational regulatory protein YebC/TACO1
MPKENIERAVAKGISKDSGDLEQVAYEFYGPGGIALIAVAVTDNRNRSTQEIKVLLGKKDCELGTPGSAAWAFTKLPDGRFKANEPLMDINGEDEEKLSDLLTHLDELDDVQEVVTNARGYESTADEE